MGVFDFVRDAGAKVGIGKSTKEIKAEENAEARAKAQKEKRAANAQERRKEASKSNELEGYVKKLGLDVERLDIRYDDGTAYISGEAATTAELEKVVVAVGNVEGVAKVDEDMTVSPNMKKLAAEASAEAAMFASASQTFHTVVSGDTLSAIAKTHYGDPNKYPAIFEANKPMLTDPDKIFVGQVLRIPKV